MRREGSLKTYLTQARLGGIHDASLYNYMVRKSLLSYSDETFMMTLYLYYYYIRILGTLLLQLSHHKLPS